MANGSSVLLPAQTSGLLLVSVEFLCYDQRSIWLTRNHCPPSDQSDYEGAMPKELRPVSSSVISRSDAPLMLRLAEIVEEDHALNASETSREFESNPATEKYPEGPSMTPYRTHRPDGTVGIDYHPD